MQYSELECAVMDAMAWDLRDLAPDLAGQFEESLPGARRNRGSGMFTEMIVSSRRPAPIERPTGDFGTVHAMIGDLPGSVAFKVSLRDGWLLSLTGDAFDQDTSEIDFQTVPFRMIFTVDDQGRSVAFHPGAVRKPSPLLALHDWSDAEAPTPPRVSRLVNVGALQRVQEDAARLDQGYPAQLDSEEAETPPAHGRALLIVWAALAIVGGFAWLALDMPIGVVGFGLVILGSYLTKPKALDLISAALRRLPSRPRGS